MARLFGVSAPAPSSARVLELDVPDADVLPAAFSPGGRYLATTTQGSAILLWRLQ